VLLDYNRATLLSKLDGLTEAQAGQPMVGSGTTLHGVVRHMTTMEQFFFVECVGGQVEPYPYYDGEEVDWDWSWTAARACRPTSTATWPCANGPGRSPPRSVRTPRSSPNAVTGSTRE
jgi:hypothetical protein